MLIPVVSNYSGDALVDTGEACDDVQNSDTQSDACRTSCTLRTCGDNVTAEGEQCDGTSNEARPAVCQADCTCEDVTGIPTLSNWGLLAMALLLGPKQTPLHPHLERSAATPAASRSLEFAGIELLNSWPSLHVRWNGEDTRADEYGPLRVQNPATGRATERST